MDVIVEADGGSRGNPGVAGYGAVVLDARGYPGARTVLAERARGIGRATNNVAEYRGLIAGLEAAADLGARTVAVRMDSKLVVEQMSGRWKVKHPDMVPLAARARELAAGFAEASYTWVPRAENAHADRLANAAMDGAPVATTAAPAGEDSTEDTPPAGGAEANAAGRRGAAAGQGPGWTAASGAPSRLVLLRHGQTELSVERRYSGRGDAPLTPLGADQAAAAARRIGARGAITAVVTSPLARACATAEASAAALGVPVAVDDDLIETDFGAWEGLTFREAAARDPGLHARWLGDPAVPPPGGESFLQVAERVRRARRRIAAEHPGESVLVVSHVTPIKMVLREALDVGYPLLYKLHLDLASISVAEFYPDGGSAVRLVNDTAHLG